MTPSNLRLTQVDNPILPGRGTDQWHRVEGLGNRNVHVLVDTSGKPTIKCVQIAVEPAVIASDLRTIPLGTIERALRHTETNQPERGLTRRTLTETPEAFAQRVADAYRWHVTRTGRPAVAMAEESGAPVGTVRRWIREARALSTIPPGTQGRAG